MIQFRAAIAADNAAWKGAEVGSKMPNLQQMIRVLITAQLASSGW